MKVFKNRSGDLSTRGQLTTWVALITVYIIWGSTYLAIKYAIVTIPPLYMAAFRFIVAGGLLFVFRLLSGDTYPTKIEWRSGAIIGIFLLLGGNGGLVLAEQRVPSSLAALIIATVPLWMTLMEIIKNRGKNIVWQSLGGVVIGFIGIMVLFWPGGSAQSDQIDPIAFIILTCSAILWAFGSLYSRNANLPKSPLMGTAMEMIVGGFSLLLGGTLLGEYKQLNIYNISLSSVLGMTYLIIFGSLVGFVAYTWLLRTAPISLVSTYAYVNPLVAIIIGYLIANETLGPRTDIAAGIILGSIVLTTMRPRVKIISKELIPEISNREELENDPKDGHQPAG
jgi:drug/metabolite transporter (DMT)-like permease